MTKIQRQTPAPVTTYANKLLVVDRNQTFSVRIPSVSKAFSGLRYLLSKEFLGRTWSLEEEVLYFYLVEYLLAYRGNKRIFQLIQNHTYSGLLRLVELRQYQLESGDKAQWVEAQKRAYSKVLMSPRAMLGIGKEFITEFFRRKNRLLNRIPPPQRFIGVGYRDKGATSEKSFDASPSWQTVGSSSLDHYQSERWSSEYTLLNFNRLRRLAS